MAGLLSSVCSSPFFQMKADIYYATEKQDEYGRVIKEWDFDGSQDCSFYTLGDMSNDDNFSYDDKKFYRMETMLYGRVRKDLRRSSDGRYHPLSHILITNIRASGCNDEIFFYETNGGYQVKPSIFEVKMMQPFIGPFSSIEYFKVQLERSDTQELENA